MPKKLFAVTNLKFGGNPSDMIDAGQEVDTEKFTKEQLVELHDAGAIEVRVVDDELVSEALDDAAVVKAAAEEAEAKARAEAKSTAETAIKAGADAAAKAEAEKATTSKPEDKK